MPVSSNQRSMTSKLATSCTAGTHTLTSAPTPWKVLGVKETIGIVVTPWDTAAEVTTVSLWVPDSCRAVPAGT